MAMAAWSARSPQRFRSSGVKAPRWPKATISAPPASIQTYAIFALSNVEAASAMPRKTASLSVADVMRRVSWLSVVRRSARSSACWISRVRGLGVFDAVRRPGRGLDLLGLLNVEAQAGVGLAQRPLDRDGGVGARGDEPEVLPALGERHHRLAGMHRHRDFLDPVDRGGFVAPRHGAQPTRARNRDHHHAGGSLLTLERVQRAAEGVAVDQLLEAQAGAEAECLGAEPADRARRDLEDPRAL